MIFLGADHGGYKLKNQIKDWLTAWSKPYKDLGAHTLDPDDDYPQYAIAVAQAMVQGMPEDKGILLCRSGGGMIIAANRFQKIRALYVDSPEAVIHARNDNDANVIGLAADWIEEAMAKTVVELFLTTPFSGERRHQRRLSQISQITESHQ